MSWSASAEGSAAEVSVKLDEQFKSAVAGTEKYPHEQRCAELAHKIVSSQLNFLSSLTPVPNVKVVANGSAFTVDKDGVVSGDSGFNLSVSVVRGK